MQAAEERKEEERKKKAAQDKSTADSKAKKGEPAVEEVPADGWTAEQQK